MLSEMLPLLFISAVSFLFPNVLPTISCNPNEARPRCAFQFYLLGSRAALKEQVLELRFCSYAQGKRTSILPVRPVSPGFPSSKEAEWMPQRFATVESGPAITDSTHYLQFKLQGKGYRSALAWRERSWWAGQGPQSPSRVAKDPGSGTDTGRPGRRRPRAGEGGGSRRPAQPIAPSAEV